MDYLLFQDTDNDSSRENSPESSIFVSSSKPTDNDLIKIYNYFVYKGYYNIVSIQLINLITTVFLYFLFMFLAMCIDYQGLIDIKTTEENLSNYVDFNNLLNSNPFYVTCMILMCFYIIIRTHGLIIDTLKYKNISKFYKKTLKIESKILPTISWSKIIEKLNILYGKEYNSYAINARILRKENILCDIYRTKISQYLFSNLMEWNIYYCFMGAIFDENNFIKRRFFENRDSIKKDIRMNLIVISILTFIFMPFLILYMIFYCLLKYGANFYNHPSKIVARQWTIKTKWNFRYYNEPKHLMDTRLDIGSIYAKEYCSQFNSKVFETILKFVIFLASSFFMVLLLLSLINEHILFNLNITHDRPVIWYMGILGSVIALGKNITHERKHDSTDESLNKLVTKIKYFPHNILEIDSLKVRDKIVKLYEYQIYTLLKECLSVIVVPFKLIYLLNFVDSIVDFIDENLERDNNLGYISKKSNFNNINDTSNLTTLISFQEHRNNFPEWGENIENFMVNSEIFDRLKENNLSIDENNLTFESHISIH